MPVSKGTGTGQNRIHQYMRQSENGALARNHAREFELQDLNRFIYAQMDKRKQAKAPKEVKEHNLAAVQKVGAKQLETIEALHEAIKVPSVNVAMDKVKKEVYTTLRRLLDTLESQELAGARSKAEEWKEKAEAAEGILKQEREDISKQISTLQNQSTELQKKIKSLEWQQLQSTKWEETARARIVELENETQQGNDANSRLETEVDQLHQEITDLQSKHALDVESEETTRLRAIDQDHQLCPAKLQAAFNQWAQSEAARQSLVTAHPNCVDSEEATRLSKVDKDHQTCAVRLFAVSADLTKSEAARNDAVAAHADCAKECDGCRELVDALVSIERRVKEIDSRLL